MANGNAVYISFNRSEDTIRHSFVSHLAAEFHRKKISNFSDSRESNASIAKTRVCVVVLSEKFASSKTCLNELVNIFKCRSNNGLTVVPVFYELTKSVLKQQCLKLVNMFPNDGIADWRRTLLEIADLPVHATSNKRSDSELVEEIVADVRQKLDRTRKTGIYSRLLKIENLLCKQPWGVQSLGIWGMGGIGKTTIAKAAFEELKDDFEASCFIQDFDRNFPKKGVYGLLKEHFGEVLKEELDMSSPVTIQSLLREKLRHKKILLILDDVYKPLRASTFLGWFDSLGAGSLIIITSRDRQVLVQCCVKEIYEVQGLNKQEALQMFSQRAFGKDVPDHNFMYLSMKLVDYADGNPLALRILGGKLSEMDNAVVERKRFLSNEIFDVFKSSYDALSDSEKNIFLDIACFFRGQDVDSVRQLLSGCGFFARVGIDVLVDKGLVTVSENRVQMHNLIHKVGLEIICHQAEEISKGYKLLDGSNIKSLLQEKEIGESKATHEADLRNEDIEALILDTIYFAFMDHKGLEKMYNLRYMKIYSSHRTKHPGLRLPKGLQSLSSELRLLHWENYPLRSFPLDFDIQHLVELNMPNSKLHKLWEGTKNLEMLKRIRLCHSQQLVNIDELQYSRNIELINLRGCSSLQSFPDTSQFQHLGVVNLSNCVKIKSFPKVPPSIRELYLQRTGISELPASNPSSESHRHLEGPNLASLGKLLFLKLKGCHHLRTLPDLVHFESLEVLNLSGCSELEEIKGFPPKLKKLYLSKTAMREIPSSLYNHLFKLVTLDMNNCKRLQDLPMGMSNMKSLATLKLSGCSKLENIWDLSRNLKELNLSGTAVKELPASLLVNLSKLVTLEMENCKKLQHLPMGMSNLKSLVTLKLSGCSELEFIHDLPLHLQNLYLVGTAIRKLPSSIGDLAQLDTLDLKNCQRLRYLPVEMRNLNPLKVLDLSHCSELWGIARTFMPLGAKLPPSFFRFHAQLVTLSLYKACVECIPEEISLLSSLETLDLSRNGFRTIPESIKECSKLVSLRLRYCKNLQVIPQLPRSLQLLNANGCVSLRSIPLDLEQLPRHYSFNDCFNLSPQMVEKVLANALAIVEHTIPQHHQELENALDFSFLAPSCENEISLRMQPHSSVMLRLTPYRRNMLVGFAISVEVAFSKDFKDAAGLGFLCVCRWNDKEGHSHRNENVYLCWTPGKSVAKIRKDHRFVFCDLKRHPIRDVPSILADLVVFELFPINKQEKLVGDSCMVTKVGVDVISDAADSSSLIKMPPLDNSLEAVELSDDEVRKGKKVSYGELLEENKAVFVYIACLFIDEKVHSLTSYLASIDDLGVCSSLNILAALSLIHISSKGEIVMHLLQREFGRDIVHGQSSSKDVISRSTVINLESLVESSQQEIESESTQAETPQNLKKVSTTEKAREELQVQQVDHNHRNTHVRSRSNRAYVMRRGGQKIRNRKTEPNPTEITRTEPEPIFLNTRTGFLYLKPKTRNRTRTEPITE